MIIELTIALLLITMVLAIKIGFFAAIANSFAKIVNFFGRGIEPSVEPSVEPSPEELQAESDLAQAQLELNQVQSELDKCSTEKASNITGLTQKDIEEIEVLTQNHFQYCNNKDNVTLYKLRNHYSTECIMHKSGMNRVNLAKKDLAVATIKVATLKKEIAHVKVKN